MIFKMLMRVSSLGCLVMVLTGCPGNDENVSNEGLVLHFAQRHYQPIETVGRLELAAGGYAQNQLEHHTVRDQNGIALSMYRAYLVIDDLQLLPCTSIAQQLFNLVIPNAYAHQGHGSEPVGGRALDKPNVIDLITQDGFILALGDTAIAPGRYCAMQISLTRLAGDAYGKPEFAAASTDDPITSPETPDMNGKIFALRSDYCAQRDSSNNCVQRQRVDIDDAGLDEVTTQTLTFTTPLELNATLREAYLIVDIEYDGWLDNIDVSLLNSDKNERQKLLNNMNASLRVDEKGLGDLPVN